MGRWHAPAQYAAALLGRSERHLIAEHARGLKLTVQVAETTSAEGHTLLEVPQNGEQEMTTGGTNSAGTTALSTYRTSLSSLPMTWHTRARNAAPRVLYERLGGVYRIATVVDDLIDRVMDDPRLNANPRVVGAALTSPG